MPSTAKPDGDPVKLDITVLTTDPRGTNRSPIEEHEKDSTTELRADDLARLVVRVDAGPATVFGSSGGAVTALALVQNHPGLVRAVVAHEGGEYDGSRFLHPESVARAVLLAVTAPPDADVTELSIRPAPR